MATPIPPSRLSTARSWVLDTTAARRNFRDKALVMAAAVAVDPLVDYLQSDVDMGGEHLNDAEAAYCAGWGSLVAQQLLGIEDPDLRDEQLILTLKCSAIGAPGA